MKKIALIIAALAVAGVSYAADSATVTTKPSYSVTSDFSYTSEYVFRGIQSSYAATQGSVEVGQDDFRVGIWTNQPTNSATTGATNEIDFYAGYKLKLDRDLTADFVATYYYYPENNGGATRNSYELGVGGTYDLVGLNPGFAGISTSLYYYYDFRLRAQTLQVSVGYSLALKDFGTSLDFSVFAGQVAAKKLFPDSGFKIRESYGYYGIGLNIPYKLAENAQVHIGTSYTFNTNVPVGTVRNNLAVNGGITLGF